MLPFLSNLLIGIAFLASLTIYFKPNPYRYLRLFPFFLLITGIVQVIGTFLSSQHKSNVVLYNLLLIFAFSFYFYTLHRMLQNKKARRIVVYVWAAFVGLAVLNMMLIQKIGVFNSMSYALGSLLIVAICIYYFFELFQHSQPVNVARQPGFWICAGLLFYYTCTFPPFGLANFMRSAPAVILKNLGTILYLLNVFLYSSFTIAFLCRIRARNSTS